MMNGIFFKGKKNQVKKSISLKEAEKWIKLKEHTWIDIQISKEKEVKDILKIICPEYQPLIYEDIIKGSRPKIEYCDGSLFIVFKYYSKDLKQKQVSFLMGNNFIITFRPKDLNLSSVYKYFNENKATVDFVLYRILEDIFETYFDVTEKMYARIEKYEKRSVKEPKLALLSEIFSVKREMLKFHRILLHERDILIPLSREPLPQIQKKTKIYLRDIYDEIILLIETEETIKETVSSLIEIYLSSVNNSTNEVMKTLTIIASFVLVPTVISGIYGMNFKLMPEIMWNLGYPFALGLMGLSVLAMYLIFKKKGWM